MSSTLTAAESLMYAQVVRQACATGWHAWVPWLPIRTDDGVLQTSPSARTANTRSTMTCNHLLQREDPVLGWDDGSPCILEAEHDGTHWDGKVHWRTGERTTHRAFKPAQGDAIIKPSEDDTITPWRDYVEGEKV